MPLDGDGTWAICTVLLQDKYKLDKTVKIYNCCKLLAVKLECQNDKKVSNKILINLLKINANMTEGVSKKLYFYLRVNKINDWMIWQMFYASKVKKSYQWPFG